MTTTEFIKLIKVFQADRKRVFVHHWNQGDQKSTDFIITESEFR